MNESQIDFVETGGALSQTDKLINVLHHANNEWVSLPQLVEAVGGYAIHSRVSDARKLGCNIINRVEFSPITNKRLSWYKLIAP